MGDKQNRANAKCGGQEPTPEALLYAAEAYNLGLGMGMEYGFGLLLSELEDTAEMFERASERIKAGEFFYWSDVTEVIDARVELVKAFVAAERKETRPPDYLLRKIEGFDPKGAMTLRAMSAFLKPSEPVSLT